MFLCLHDQTQVGLFFGGVKLYKDFKAQNYTTQNNVLTDFLPILGG